MDQHASLGDRAMTRALRVRLYQILEAGRSDDPLSRLLDGFLIVLILANVAAAVADTVPSVTERWHDPLVVFEVVSVAIFTVEYACRLWVAPEQLSLTHRHPVSARLRYAVSPFAIIDLLAILPFYVALVVPIVDLRFLRVFRLLRLLKLARYSPALGSLGRVIADERRALIAALLIMMALLLVTSTAIFYAEHTAQPEKFASIPNAMWWALATLTTVGYGDVYPVTVFGRLVGGVTMIMGLVMFALPVAIVSSGFATEIHRRDFVVTWGMVARVPLFARLNALSVSRITNLLQSRTVPPGTVIVRRGDTGDAMYFIVAGEVEVELEPAPKRLVEGDFFGELALLHDVKRTATVRAVTRCRLLVLERDEFGKLMSTDRDLRLAIAEVADQRMAH
jgi:voltage-gated potassium channel